MFSALARALGRLAGGMLLLLALLLSSAWLWSGQAQSLSQTLNWLQDWLTDADGVAPLQVQGASGSLREGGRIERLHWRRDGLELELDGLELRWPTELWAGLVLQRELRLDRLAVVNLRLHDTRPPRPDTPPPQDLRLPWLKSVRLPLQAGELTVEIGNAPALRLGPLRADYGYGPDAQGEPGHKLQIDALRWAQGNYQLQARLQAVGELALEAQLQGQVEAAVPGGRAQALAASAHLSGKLAGAQAALELAASASPQASVPGRDGTRLQASATIRPWSNQPLPQAQLELQGIDLAAFWPQAPTTRLQGHWQIEHAEHAEQDPAGHARWRLTGSLHNGAAGAWDRHALPIERLRAELALSDSRWQLKALDAQLPGGGQLQAEGELDRTAPWARPGAWQGRLTAHLPEPRALLTGLALAPLTLQARVTPQSGREAAFELALIPEGRSVSGASVRLSPRLQAAGGWDGERLQLERAELDFLDADLKASGTLRPRAGALAGEFALALPGASLKAELRADGGQAEWATNDMERLQRWLQTSLDRIRPLLPGSKPIRQLHETLALAALDGQARIEANWSGPLQPARLPPRWSARAQVAQARIAWPAASGTPPLRIADTQLTLDGDAGRITLALDGQARSGDWTLHPTLRARGELGPAGQAAELLIEQAELRASDATRSLSGRLTTPGGTRLGWSTDQVLRLAPGQAVIALPLRDGERTAEIHWDETRWSRGLLESSGRASGLELAWLDALLASPAAPSGPLAQTGLMGEVKLQGRWELRLPMRATGADAQLAHARLELARSGGDLRLILPESAGGQPQAIGLEQASASLALDGARLQGRLRWSSRLAGQLNADFGTELAPPSPASAGWSWPAEAPLSGRLQAALPQLGLWSSFAPPGWRMRGSVRADASLGGNRRQPEWRGTLHAGELALRSLIDGIDFSDGELDATLDGATLKLDRLRLRGAGGASGGLLLGSGLLHWSRPASAPGQPVAALEPELTLDLQAQTLRLLARADRRLMLSGKVAARLDGRRLDVSGRLRADQALFILPDEDTPVLGDDVVVRGQSQPARAQATSPLQTRLRLELALGDNFHLRGQGLDTDLRGELLLSANPGQTTPQLTGQIRTERGHFRAWGQTLEIEAGVLSFNGPYDNPDLDILALRPLNGQRVGVQLGGSALAPRLRLYADPELPESEKLAWLVLGRPASGAGSEAALLQQAALALLSGRGRAADGDLTRALGLDELSLRGQTHKADGSTSAAALTLGKRISRQLYLSYTRSMIGATGTVAMLYDLTRNFTVRAQAGDENALDLIFTRQYDGNRQGRR